MRRGRSITLVAALALAITPAAFAGPYEIQKDLADNGRLDGNYTAAELRAAAANPSLQQYPTGGLNSGGNLVPLDTQQGQVLGEQQTQAGGQPLAESRQQGQLPFTGLELSVALALGLALLGGGVMLRRLSRNES